MKKLDDKSHAMQMQFGVIPLEQFRDPITKARGAYRALKDTRPNEFITWLKRSQPALLQEAIGMKLVGLSLMAANETARARPWIVDACVARNGQKLESIEFNNLGLLEHMEGNYSACREHLERGLSLRPDFGAIWHTRMLNDCSFGLRADLEETIEQMNSQYKGWRADAELVTSLMFDGNLAFARTCEGWGSIVVPELLRNVA